MLNVLKEYAGKYQFIVASERGAEFFKCEVCNVHIKLLKSADGKIKQHVGTSQHQEAATARYQSQPLTGFIRATTFNDEKKLMVIVTRSVTVYEKRHLCFRTLYLPAKVHLISLANWCSAIAIWLVIAICAERLIGIGNCELKKLSCCRTSHVIVANVLFSGALTSYNHFSYNCVVKQLCNDTQIISKCFDVIQESWSINQINITPNLIRSFVEWSQVVNVVFVIVLPILIMMALNLALLFVVRQQSFLMYNRLQSAPSLNSDFSGAYINGMNAANGAMSFKRKVSAMSDCRRKSSVVVFVDGAASEVEGSTLGAVPTSAAQNQSNNNLFRRSIDQTMQFQAEHRVTVTVCAIVTCFTITQGPSAIVLSLSFFSGHKPPFVNSNALWYQANCLTAFLVIIGKTLNFILFCLSSAAFRRRLKRILQSKLLSLSERRSSFLASSSGGVAAQQTVNQQNSNYTSSLRKPHASTERRFSLAT